MIVIGLTGSMAMGKSTAANMLAAMDGVTVHCSDDNVRALYDDPEIIDLIKTTFPSAYDKKRKLIDKKKLLAFLGTDHERWGALEEILHPRVQQAQQKFLREQQALGTKISVLDIPLLFETGGENRLDYTIVVQAPAFIQQQRIRERIKAGKMSDADAQFRFTRQMPSAEKCARADFVVPTGQGMAFTRRALEKIIAELKEKHFPGNRMSAPLTP